MTIYEIDLSIEMSDWTVVATVAIVVAFLALVVFSDRDEPAERLERLVPWSRQQPWRRK